MYLEFRRGFADGSNSPRANSGRMIEHLPRRTGEDEGYAANLFKENQENQDELRSPRRGDK
jgi:hypothetical protein